MPTATKTRRQKVQAMAEQTASPAEAEVAKAKLALIPENRLDDIAEEVRSAYSKNVETQFAIGRLLLEARTLLPGDHDFSEWLQKENFAFGNKTAYYLRLGAEREQEVRALIDGRPEGARDIGVTSVVYYMLRDEQQAKRAAKPAPTFTMDEVSENHRTDSEFIRWKQATRSLLGVVVSDDDEATETWPERPFIGVPDKKGLRNGGLHIDDLAEAGALIKRLAVAYTEAKTFAGLTQAEREEVDRGERVL